MSLTGLDPISLAILLAALGLIPLLLMITTCFLKIAIVLQLLRNAMGVQQVPPNMVLYGISAALTIFIMAPVFEQTQNIVSGMDKEAVSERGVLPMLGEALVPLKKFMEKNTSPSVLAVFQETAEKMWGEEVKERGLDNKILVLIPAFVVSELQAGFEIGFILYLPFIIVDLIISNLLLALGMQMVAPMTFSLPIKILLFVMVDGWEKLMTSLVLSYF